MTVRVCPTCSETMAEGCFRKHASACVWCTFASKAKRADARYRDKMKLVRSRVNIDLAAFVAWYVSRDDCCAYCGLTFAELRTLKIKRGGGYCVAWDVDRIDSTRPYEVGNLALSCFVCNMAKGDMLSAAEARVVGAAVRTVWRARLAAL